MGDLWSLTTSEHDFPSLGLIIDPLLSLRGADSPLMFNVSKTSSHLTQEWKLDIYLAMWTLGKKDLLVRIMTKY